MSLGLAKPPYKKVMQRLLLVLKRLNNTYKIGSIGFQFQNPKNPQGQAL